MSNLTRLAHYYKTNGAPKLGDDVPAATPTTFDSVIHSDAVKTASGIALTYHGYKRTGSWFWAIAYGFLGHSAPTLAVPVALAQGFGKSKHGGAS